jgi:hypothetical protein
MKKRTGENRKAKANIGKKLIKSFMKKTASILLSLFMVLAGYAQEKHISTVVIAHGQMPAIAKDKKNNIHVVYGTGDSIMYIFSKDGKSFSAPLLVAFVPDLFASAMRGPQIAAVENGLIIMACDKEGNLHSFRKNTGGRWSKSKQVNGISGISKEGLTALDANGSNAYAAWLGVNNPKGQSVYFARSVDGGKSWNKNNIVYASPSGTVCECCKPSLKVSGNKVYIMFRNFLSGNRDLYLIGSSDGGKTFGQAQKLGVGSWQLDGCPMDGGGLAIAENKTAETVWRREGKIYRAEPGQPEKEIGEGKACTVETINNKNVYAWTNHGNIIIMKPGSVKMNMGKGNLPLLKWLTNEKVICIWENEDKIQASVFKL